jgi:hypothetical protein
MLLTDVEVSREIKYSRMWPYPSIFYFLDPVVLAKSSGEKEKHVSLSHEFTLK